MGVAELEIEHNSVQLLFPEIRDAGNGIEVEWDPADRSRMVDYFLRLDGLVGIKEDPQAAYCALPLTNTPVEVKPYLLHR